MPPRVQKKWSNVYTTPSSLKSEWSNWLGFPGTAIKGCCQVDRRLQLYSSTEMRDVIRIFHGIYCSNAEMSIIRSNKKQLSSRRPTITEKGKWRPFLIIICSKIVTVYIAAITAICICAQCGLSSYRQLIWRIHSLPSGIEDAVLVVGTLWEVAEVNSWYDWLSEGPLGSAVACVPVCVV